MRASMEGSFLNEKTKYIHKNTNPVRFKIKSKSVKINSFVLIFARRFTHRVHFSSIVWIVPFGLFILMPEYVSVGIGICIYGYLSTNVTCPSVYRVITWRSHSWSNTLSRKCRNSILILKMRLDVPPHFPRPSQYLISLSESRVTGVFLASGVELEEIEWRTRLWYLRSKQLHPDKNDQNSRPQQKKVVPNRK